MHARYKLEVSKMMDKYSQKAGDNSLQLQAETITVVQGPIEEVVRAILGEREQRLLREYSAEAHDIVHRRLLEFATVFIPKIVKDNFVESLKDPSVQILLLEAQKTAASTERETDYELLAELLVHRIKDNSDRKVRAGISNAVKIVDEISYDSLLGLTVSYCFKFNPTAGSIIDGLVTLNSFFGTIIYADLPIGEDWLDHLDTLNAVRIINFATKKGIDQFYPEALSGYIDVGIKIDSDCHIKAQTLIKENNLPANILVHHELREGYLRIPITNREGIEQLIITKQPLLEKVPLSLSQKQAVIDIYSLYEKNEQFKQEHISKFMKLWNDQPNLKTFKEWWDKIPVAFSITSIGRALAQANAQRCYPDIPKIY